MKVVIYKKSLSGKLRRIVSQKQDIAIAILDNSDKDLIKRMRKDANVYSYLGSFSKFGDIKEAQRVLQEIVNFEKKITEEKS